MSAAAVTASLSPTILRKRAINSGESGGAAGFTIFILVPFLYLAYPHSRPTAARRRRSLIASPSPSCGTGMTPVAPPAGGARGRREPKRFAAAPAKMPAGAKITPLVPPPNPAPPPLPTPHHH